MNVLSLDISTASTGWCVTKDGSLFTIGTIPISTKLDNYERLAIFAFNLISLLNTYKPRYVVQEDIFSGKNVKTMKLLCEFAGVSKYLCYNVLGVVPYIISNKTVKAYFKAQDKQMLFDFICVLFEKSFSFKKDNDMIDALAQMMCFTDKVLDIYSYRLEKGYGYIYNGGYIGG